jgi:chemosensory pili system protein ChpE
MGVAFAAPPGAVTAETFRRGVRGGFPLAFGVQLGSLIGDATYALLAIAGLAALAQNSFLQLALGALGALFLLYLAWTSFQNAVIPLTIVGKSELGAERRGAFLSGLALSLTNPWAIAFWLSLGGALVSIGLNNASARQIAFFFASFMLGSAVWAIFLSFAIARVRRWIRPVLFQVVSITCGLALGAFGLFAASRVISLIVGS